MDRKRFVGLPVRDLFMRSGARWPGSVAMVFVCFTFFGCQRSAPSPQVLAGSPTDAPPAAPAPGLPWFEDATAAAGIDFRHYDSTTPLNTVPEMMGSGLGWVDYDGDGWPDLFCVQDGPLRPADAKGPPPTNKLYRNNGDGTFADVTERAGLARAGFGMGCAVGDFDNDGFDD